MKEVQPKLVIIAGPTASGKTRFGVELARRFGGEVINADSMQVYRGMDVGTAKPTREERGGIPHHLMDVVDPDEPFNAAVYRSHAIPVIQDVLSRDRACFVVGGTGLYIKTLLGGLLDCPKSDPLFRNRLIEECDEHGSSYLHDRLKRVDPESARRIHPNDKIRIARALEIIHVTERPLSTLEQEHRFRDRLFTPLKICLHLERGSLYNRIDERALSMVRSGLVEETRDLLNKGYSPYLKPMQSIGYRHALTLLKGTWDREEMILQLQTDTRRYAKRQLTWFRADREMQRMENDPESRDRVCKMIEEFLSRRS
ncbi:MAG: tRNA (adenosine(37)-N6)-dimethylallyltransferase MiaA [Pseudomonadota bacterium]